MCLNILGISAPLSIVPIYKEKYLTFVSDMQSNGSMLFEGHYSGLFSSPMYSRKILLVYPKEVRSYLR